MKKLMILFFALLFAVLLPVQAAGESLYNSELEVHSDILYLKSLDDGTVIFDKNASMRCSPAALLNIVTAMLVLEKVPDVNTATFTVPADILNRIAGTDSATMLFQGGEVVRVVDLLHCILMRSAADASITLAAGVAGTVEAFVEQMNAYAKNAGCRDTHFTNVTGLDDEEQYTTAADMAVLLTLACQNETFKAISMTETYDFPATNVSSERMVYTSNLMLKSGYTSYYYKYITAAKTGATSNAGRCVAAVASRDGYSYVAVVMKGQFADLDGNGVEENYAFIDCKAMLSWTFQNIRLRTITDSTQTVGEVTVRYSSRHDHVRLVPAQQITALVPAAVDTGSVVFEILEDQTKTTVNAPVKQGDILGKARVLYGEQVIATVDLAAAEDIPFDLPGFLTGAVKSVFSSPPAVILLILIVAAAVAYFVIGIRYDKKAGKFRIMKGGKKSRKENGKDGE